MNKALLVLITLQLFFSYRTYCQTKAITDEGEEVILYSDKTWKYANIKAAYDTRLDTPSFTKHKDATFLVKSKKVNFGTYINPKKWAFSPSKDQTGTQEYTFNYKKGDAYVISIPERVEYSYELLKKAAIINAQGAAPDAHITREEGRIVNGQYVMVLEIEGTLSGILFKYFGYYYVGEIGSIQLIGFTTAKMFDEYKSEIEELLNGFTLLEQ